MRFFGTVPNSGDALAKALLNIGKNGATLKVCYESGPCGFVIYRLLTKLGINCVLDAASTE